MRGLAAVAIEGVPEKAGLRGVFFQREKRCECFAGIGIFQAEATARGSIHGLGAGGSGVAITGAQVVVMPLQETGIELFPG